MGMVASKVSCGPVQRGMASVGNSWAALLQCCLLYTSDAADERSSVDLGGRRIIKKKNYEASDAHSNNEKNNITNRSTGHIN